MGKKWNKRIIIFFLAAVFSISLLSYAPKGRAQMSQYYYYSFLPYFPTQNFTWQDYNFYPTSGFPYYQYQWDQTHLAGFNQIPYYNLNPDYGLWNQDYNITAINQYVVPQPFIDYSALQLNYYNRLANSFYMDYQQTFSPFSLNTMLNLAPVSIKPALEVSEYLAVLPKTLRIGKMETVSISLFNKQVLRRKRSGNKIKIILSKNGEKIFQEESYIDGKGIISFMVPDIEVGKYELIIGGDNFSDGAEVNVEEDILIFMQTDKPIYQPGQTMHMRVITLDSELKPKSENAVVEILDSKGIKIFKKEVLTDEYGLANLDLPISKEPNLGVWTILVLSGPTNSQVDVRVEKYVLPKYEVKAELPREWFLVDEPIVGKVKAEYSFGKPVKGEVMIKASRYVGEWQVYETFTTQIDGEADFWISPAAYVAGVPAAGGKGNVTLDINVIEGNTNYEEKTNRLLTISDSTFNLQIIPESSVFKPSLPFNLLVVAKTPDHDPYEAGVNVKISYLNESLNEMGTTEDTVQTIGGKALFTFTPPEGCVALIIEAEAEGVEAEKALQAGHSPTGSFIHLEQLSQGIPKVGEEIWFKIHSTKEAVNFYYEVMSRGKVIFSDYTNFDEISITVTPMMAPSAKILVYQILPNSEVAADYLPFEVEADYPLSINASFSADEVKPGEDVSISIKTEGKAKIGLAAVDKSVFILAENRLNLHQVFEELERLYMKPQAELHVSTVYSEVCTKGAEEIFNDAGVIVVSNKMIPKGKEYNKYPSWGEWGMPWPVWGGWAPMGGALLAFNASSGQNNIDLNSGLESQTPSPIETEELAEVERVRQFFPETWIWQDLITDDQGNASINVEAPDTITTWKLQAVALSQDKGLGIDEEDLRVFQPFFIKIDLPYSAIRGEEFPIKVSIYNYLNENQNVFVTLMNSDWFCLLDDPNKTVEIQANDIGGTQFMIRPEQLGLMEVEVTAKSISSADAVIKTIIIAPEGVERDCVENKILKAGECKQFNTSIPPNAVEGSGRAYIAATSSYLAQTMEGLEGLLKMPFGCGEQNMICLAPDVYITQYLKDTGQLKTEIMAKAEKLMITGYQRELTYRRSDGSFSAFGDRDEQGSLWLTAFVLKVFSQAKGLMYIDEDVLNEARNWLINHQNADGSFDSIGFVHHKEMIGGLNGKTALTAFTAIALREAGEITGATNAVGYLEGRLEEIDDAYTMALAAYALELAESTMRDQAYNKLMSFSQTDENGLYWPASGADIEATAYAALALMKHSDTPNAGQAVKWLVSKRNAFGGFSSTQDTVMALEALTLYSKNVTAEVNLTIQIILEESVYKVLTITNENYDVLQNVEVPINEQINISANGMGQALIQLVKRFNLPTAQSTGQTFNILVDYDTTQVEVNDLVNVSVDLGFTPFMSIEAGMVVLDISVPTGFAPVIETLEDLLKTNNKIKRYDVAGRKVIFYIENMYPDEHITFIFQVKAKYPVKAKGTVSQAYSYYHPEMKGETLSEEMVVSEQ